jgi:hypothetical protein
VYYSFIAGLPTEVLGELGEVVSFSRSDRPHIIIRQAEIFTPLVFFRAVARREKISPGLGLSKLLKLPSFSFGIYISSLKR